MQFWKKTGPTSENQPTLINQMCKEFFTEAVQGQIEFFKHSFKALHMDKVILHFTGEIISGILHDLGKFGHFDNNYKDFKSYEDISHNKFNSDHVKIIIINYKSKDKSLL